MIRIRFLEKEGRTLGIESQGHAGPQKPFSILNIFRKEPPLFGNLLCSAVSILMARLDTAVRLQGIEAIENQKKPGFYFLLLNDRDFKSMELEFQALRSTLKGLQEKYKDQLMIIEEAIHGS